MHVKNWIQEELVMKKDVPPLKKQQENEVKEPLLFFTVVENLWGEAEGHT